MVLLDEGLEKFLITADNIDNFYRQGVFNKFTRWILQTTTPSTYTVLDERRKFIFKEELKSNHEFVEFAKNQHGKAMEFLTN